MTKRSDIEKYLLGIYSSIGMDKPRNHDEILDFVVEDVDETADPENWHSGDVLIAFRRWMESKETPDEGNYFKIIHQGFQPELLREEIQIHAGDSGNVFLIKTDQGFIVDVYGNGENVDTMVIFKEDLEPDEEDDEEIIEISKEEIENFVEKWGQSTNEVCTELCYDLEDSDDLLMVDYFWYKKKEYWIPITSSNYNEKEQMIANYLRSI